MATSSPQREEPVWLVKDKIDESQFCEELLQEEPMICIHDTFFTVDGKVTDLGKLRNRILTKISPYIRHGLSRKTSALLDVLRDRCYSEPLPVCQDRIHVANGTLYLDGRFEKEKEFCLNRLPVSYHPDAPKPERWLRFVEELLYPEDIPTLQEYMGYCLIPSTRAQKMLLLVGKGGEGKSRIGVVLAAMLGQSMYSGSIAKVETSAFARADLEFELLMVDDDMKMEALPKTNIIKSIVTAETLMDLERKGKQSYQGIMYARLMGFGNGTLKSLYDRSLGFFRRQIILNTRDKAEGRIDDPFLSDKLKSEVDGIFLWALEGLHRLIANDYHFTVSERAELGPDMLFADYMIAWLAIAKSNTAVTTYNGYVEHVHKHIAPWFRERGITLGELQARHIQSYYLYRLEQVSGSSVRREHSNIHRALKHAVMMDLIPFNPTDKTQPPKNNDYEAKYYNARQLEALFEATKTHKLGLLFQMVAFYGMRRGEALGLRWDAIDFERNVFTIRHTVTECKIDGKQTLVQQDRAKNRSSRRTMPLAPGFKMQLMALKARQEENRKLAGNSYNPEFIGYVFVDELGNLFRPSYVSSTFRALLEKNNLPRIRFHDLRHSCATLLVQSGIPINTVSDWVGHSDVTTTLKFYAHLDDRAKLIPAHQMETTLNLPECTLPRPWE